MVGLMPMQVCVDMGEPILKAADVPTTLQPTQVRMSAAVGRREKGRGAAQAGSGSVQAGAA